MASTNFIDKTTVVPTAWLNEVNGTVWTLFGAATTASDGRTALGLGTMATQNSSNVTITGGTITGLSSPLPVASGGTGSSTSTGSGSVVLQTNPTINGLGVSGLFSTSASSGGDFVQFINTAAGAEAAVRVDATQATSGASLKLSNSGLNKQVTYRVNSDGGTTIYVNQTAGGASTSGTSALTITGAGATSVSGNFNAVNITSSGTTNSVGALSENSMRVFSRASQSSSTTTTQDYTSASTLYTFPHGLGQKPVSWQIFAECVTAEHSYSVGDVIDITGASGTGSVNSSVDATNLYIAVAGQINCASKAASPAFVNLTPSAAPVYWKLFARAWY